MAIVIDASVTMAWCFEDEATSGAEAVLDRLADEGVIVPVLWRLEVANVLLVAERRRRISEAQASRFVDVLSRLPVDVDPTPPDVAAVLDLARRHALSSYDSAYLALAERLGLPLATIDVRLATAARATGVPVLAAG